MFLSSLYDDLPPPSNSEAGDPTTNTTTSQNVQPQAADKEKKPSGWNQNNTKFLAPVLQMRKKQQQAQPIKKTYTSLPSSTTGVTTIHSSAAISSKVPPSNSMLSMLSQYGDDDTDMSDSHTTSNNNNNNVDVIHNTPFPYGKEKLTEEEVIDPYDPAYPNEYEDVMREREIKLPRRDRDWEGSNGGGKSVRFNDEPMTATYTPQSNEMDSSAMPPAVEPKPKVNIAEKMMAKMGWSYGKGLGKSEQGITTPLQHKKTGKSTGTIVQSPSPLPGTPSQPPPQQHTASLRGKPSRVLLLRNMVGPGEVDAELQAETAEECSKYGTSGPASVLSVVVYEVMDGSLPPEEAVRIFVRFDKMDAAIKCAIDLDGRFFAGRVVDVCFYSEDRFDANDFNPNPALEVPRLVR